jgi:nucleotidyltransferase substrate binding protein (TIGR01987 family)
VSTKNLSELERGGLIHYFEVAFELGWKVLKDYLIDDGFKEVMGPKTIIKVAFEQGLITDGHTWLQALEDRNLTTHTYDFELAMEVENSIRNEYYPLLITLENDLDKRVSR